jgi:hypothetical protein
MSATRKTKKVRLAVGTQQAHAGRAAWGVLGSAAGGRVFRSAGVNPSQTIKVSVETEKTLSEG